MLFAQPYPFKFFNRTSPGFDSAAHSAREFAISRFFRQVSLFSLIFLAPSLTSWAQTSVLTQHNDTLRTGLNPNETILTTSNVTVSQFGKLFARPVDGQVYAQPLYVPNVSIAGGKHNVLIVATEADSVYAFDADSNAGANSEPLWKASLVDAAHGAAAGETPLNAATTIDCDDLQPQIGITSTPVIDPVVGTIYVESKSVNASTYIHRLHALDLATGNEKSPGPAVITATVNGTGDGSLNGKLTFDSLHQLNRPGLLLLNGTVYVAFASHCDYSPYHGWLFAYDATSLAQMSVFVSDPTGGLGGFWMSGAGVAADANSNIYIASGNGTFDTVNVPATNLGDSIIKLGTTNAILSLLDYFTPYDQASLNSSDDDLGSGGVMLLPDQPGTYPHLLVEANKRGQIFVINRDQMTTNNLHYCTTNCNNGDPQILEESSAGLVGGIFSAPAYWNSTLYFWGKSDNLQAIPVTNGLPDFTHITGSTQTISFPGATPAISSNGTASGTAILWAIDSSQYGPPGAGPGPAVVYAYDATNLSRLLWTSAQASNGRDQAGNAVKFAVPTIVNGKVYIGTSSEVDIYGLLPPPLPTPQISPGSETFTGSVAVSISDSNSSAALYYTTDGSTPSPGVGTTQLYKTSFSVSATTTVQAIATATGYANSPVAAATYTLQSATSGPSIRVRAGTSTSYTDPSGNVWVGDVDYLGGTEAAPITHAIANTTTQPLYQTERYNGFTYTFTGLPIGSSYVVTLKFAEDYWTAAGKRIFNVILNGTTVLSNFDIFANSGGAYIADDKTFSTTVNSSGQIVIQFQNGSADYAKIDAIQLVPSAPLPTPQISPGSETFTGSVAVSISDSNSSAALYYTTDGSTPSPGVGTTQLYKTSFSVSATTTVQAIAAATGYANSPVAAATYTLQSATSGPSIRVRAGTSTSYTDPSGNVWVGDVDYLGGTEAAPITHAIANTTTQPLYQTERYNGFTYTFTGLPIGSSYVVTLKFAEDYWTAAGKRIFNVILNGTTVLSNFDIFANSGGAYIADDKTFSTTVNSSGQIVIQFQNGSADYAKIDAIQLVPSAPLPTPQISPGSETFTGSVAVSISDSNSSAALYYTTDGSTPSPGVGTTQLYKTSFSVSATTTVQAIAAATGYANSPVAAATYTLQSATSGPSIRVRAGTSTSYTDPSGNVWVGDVDYLGGTEAAPITHAIANTTTQPLYQTERYNGFTYTFTGLPIGSSYVVTLKFAEDYWTAAGKRIFNVILNGTTVLSNFDIFANSGGAYIADDKTFSTTVNSSGQIVIQFQNGSADYAKIDAIQLVP